MVFGLWSFVRSLFISPVKLPTRPPVNLKRFENLTSPPGVGRMKYTTYLWSMDYLYNTLTETPNPRRFRYFTVESIQRFRTSDQLFKFQHEFVIAKVEVDKAVTDTNKHCYLYYMVEHRRSYPRKDPMDELISAAPPQVRRPITFDTVSLLHEAPSDGTNVTLLETIRPNDMTLADFTILVSSAMSQSDQSYSLFKNQCSWFANSVMRIGEMHLNSNQANRCSDRMTSKVLRGPHRTAVLWYDTCESIIRASKDLYDKNLAKFHRQLESAQKVQQYIRERDDAMIAIEQFKAVAATTSPTSFTV